MLAEHVFATFYSSTIAFKVCSLDLFLLGPQHEDESPPLKPEGDDNYCKFLTGDFCILPCQKLVTIR